jgi:hypothetical protein
MTDTPKFTTQLQAGLGLVPETLKLLAAWEPGMGGQDCQSALEWDPLSASKRGSDAILVQLRLLCAD